MGAVARGESARALLAAVFERHECALLRRIERRMSRPLRVAFDARDVLHSAALIAMRSALQRRRLREGELEALMLGIASNLLRHLRRDQRARARRHAGHQRARRAG